LKERSIAKVLTPAPVFTSALSHMPSPPLKIILDTDPGGDDTFALLWLLSLVKQGKAQLIAITTTDGNVSAEQTFTNASQLLKLMNSSEIVVGRGRSHAQTEDASHIHGNDGLGGLARSLSAPSHNYKTAPYSEELLIKQLQANPGEITIVAIGPLTNLANAEVKNPGVLQQAKEIVIMGGAFYHRGNVTSEAEFNIWFNPEAAQTVLHSRWDSVVIPLDVTHELIFTRDMARTIHMMNPPGKLPTFLMELCEFMISTALNYRETNDIPGFLVHDAATIAYLFYSETMLFRRARVSVETTGTWTRGKTVIDDRPLPKPDTNAWVALQVDKTQFFTHLIADLKYLMRS